MIRKIGQKVLGRKVSGDPRKAWGRLMLKVLHPHGIPFFRRLWTTPEQRARHDEK